MKAHHSELISALVDGELKGLRRWRVRRHVSQCATCAAEYRNLQHVRQMMAANPATPPMSDSPEFFWSKVKREIQAREGSTVDEKMPALSLSDWLGQHRFAWVSATTMVVAVVGIMFLQRAPREGDTHVAIIQPPMVAVEHSATFIADAVATTIDSTDTEPVVIWVSGLPWSADITEMKTQFAQLDS